MGSCPSLPRSSPASTPSPAPRPSPPATSLSPSNTLCTTPGPGGGWGRSSPVPHLHPWAGKRPSPGDSPRPAAAGTACTAAAGGAAPRAPAPRCPGACGRSARGSVSASGAPRPFFPWRGGGSSCRRGSQKGPSPLRHGPTAEPRAGQPCHVGGVPRGAGGHSHSQPPGPRPPPHLSGPAGSPLFSGVSGAVPGEGSGEMAASPGSPRPLYSDMARAGTERASEDRAPARDRWQVTGDRWREMVRSHR